MRHGSGLRPGGAGTVRSTGPCGPSGIRRRPFVRGRTSLLLLLLLLLLLAIGAGSCGRRGPPQPPLRVSPETPELRPLRQENGEIVIRWVAPRGASGRSGEAVQLRRAVVLHRVVDLQQRIRDTRTSSRSPAPPPADRGGETGEVPNEEGSDEPGVEAAAEPPAGPGAEGGPLPGTAESGASSPGEPGSEPPPVAAPETPATARSEPPPDPGAPVGEEVGMGGGDPDAAPEASGGVAPTEPERVADPASTEVPGEAATTMALPERPPPVEGIEAPGEEPPAGPEEAESRADPAGAESEPLMTPPEEAPESPAEPTRESPADPEGVPSESVTEAESSAPIETGGEEAAPPLEGTLGRSVEAASERPETPESSTEPESSGPAPPTGAEIQAPTAGGPGSEAGAPLPEGTAVPEPVTAESGESGSVSERGPSPGPTPDPPPAETPGPAPPAADAALPGEQPTDEQPIDERPTDERPSGEPTADEQASGESPSGEGAPDEGSPEETPGDESADDQTPAEPEGIPVDLGEGELEVLAEVESEILGEEKTLRLPVKPEWVGRRLLVAVRYESRSDPSEDSDLRELDVTAPLPTVTAIETEVGDGEVALRWDDLRPAATAAAPLSRPLFEVYRRRGTETRRTALVPTPAWSDGSVVWGAEVCYSVQLVAVGDDEPRLLDDPGPEADADPGAGAAGKIPPPEGPETGSSGAEPDSPGDPAEAEAPAASGPVATAPAVDESRVAAAEPPALGAGVPDEADAGGSGGVIPEAAVGEEAPREGPESGSPGVEAQPPSGPAETEAPAASGPAAAVPAVDESRAAAAELPAPGGGGSDEADAGRSGEVLPEAAVGEGSPREGPEAGSPGVEAQPPGGPAEVAEPPASEAGLPDEADAGGSGEGIREAAVGEEAPRGGPETGSSGAEAQPPDEPEETEEPAASGPHAEDPDRVGSAAAPDAPPDPGWTPVIVRVPPTGAEAVSAGARSPEVCLVPADLYAPPPPTDLRAFWQPEGTDLNWEASAAPDVAGYRVYRSETDDSGYELLAEAPADLLTVTDRDRDPGTEYTYAVTAVDAAGTPNESPRSAPVRVRPRRP